MKPVELIQELRRLKTELANLSERRKELEEQRSEIEGTITAYLKENELSDMSDGTDRVSLTLNLVPQVTDWPALYAHIRENDAFYLLERRALATAYRELREQGDEVPGMEDYYKPTISLRKR